MGLRSLKKSETDKPVSLSHFREWNEIEKEKLRPFNVGISMSGRAFVYYYITENGKRKRKKSHVANRAKDLESRKEILLSHKREIEERLLESEGFIGNGKDSISNMTDRMLAIKKKSLKPRPYLQIQSSYKHFKDFLKKNNIDQVHPSRISRGIIHKYSEYLLSLEKRSKSGEIKKLKNRTVNNHLSNLSALFNYIIEKYDDILVKNPTKGFDSLPSRSEKNVAYTEQEIENIKTYLHNNDPYLLLFCKFIIYVFMRPAEICSLRARDFDTVNWTITIPAANTKQNQRKKKKIPEIFRPTIESLAINKAFPGYYLFTNKQTPGPTQIGKNYFVKRFKKVKKKFGFSNLHTMYGLRHTFVCQLCRNGAEDRDVMALTGHSTQSAFEKYKRDLGVIDSKDVSEFYSNAL